MLLFFLVRNVDYSLVALWQMKYLFTKTLHKRKVINSFLCVREVNITCNNVLTHMKSNLCQLNTKDLRYNFNYKCVTVDLRIESSVSLLVSFLFVYK